jgi:hypothetical protein
VAAIVATEAANRDDAAEDRDALGRPMEEGRLRVESAFLRGLLRRG